MVFTPPSVPLLGDRNLPYLFSKTYPSFLTIKEGFFESLRLPLAKGSSTFLTKPLFPQEREDVAGSAIAPPGFWTASGACARKGLAESAYAIKLRLSVA